MGKFKKFETFSDSVVVEALKVMIIVAVEAGFPCIPVILESEGRGEHLFERGVCLILWSKGRALIRLQALIQGSMVYGKLSYLSTLN